MTPETFLQSIGRKEIEKLATGEKTGEYLITPAELAEYGRMAFEAARELAIGKAYNTIHLYPTPDDYIKHIKKERI